MVIVYVVIGMVLFAYKEKVADVVSRLVFKKEKEEPKPE